MIITNLAVNHIANPLGYDLGAKPTFSWIVEESAGTIATASRVVVTCDGNVVTDTGWADLDAKACALSLDLMPRTRYAWTVSVRTDAGEEATSEPAWFETGKMAEPWAAQWLTCDYAEPRHPIFTRELGLDPEHIVSARLYVCGLGLYSASIDGEPVGEEHLAPGTHAYDSWLQYQTYDVTESLRRSSGTSELAIMLGHGWYSGRFSFILSNAGYYGDDWRLIAELRIRYADGSEHVVCTDDSWQVRRSTITFSNIYDGEHRDDTLPELPAVQASLLDAGKAAAATKRLHARLSLPVVAHETFSPTLIKTPSGEQVLDLGQNISGIFRLRVHAPAGTRIRLQFGELLQDGNFYRDNLRTAKAEYLYICDGTEKIVEPAFTFYGYQYVKVEGIDIDPADFTGVALYSDFDSCRGTVVTGSSKVNKLISNARWGMRDNFLDTPTDCPQRDERMGWTGDANVFSGTALRLANPYAFYRKYLYDMALEQKAREGGVPWVIPSFGQPHGSAIWGDATCFIPWNMYQAEGDPAILAEHFDAMCGWVDWIDRTDGDDHGWGGEFHYGDWLSLDSTDRGGRKGGTDEGLIAYVYWWRSTCIVADAARVLGRDDDAARYDAMAARIRSWIEAEYFTATGRCAVTTQTAYVLSITYGLGNTEWSAQRLRSMLQLNDNHLTTGFCGTPLLCPALTKVGHNREAYDLLLNEDYPSWLFAVNLGATTVWERWNSLDETGHITGIDMNSMNHYSYGAIVEWLFSCAAGLTPTTPGYATARIAPHVDWRLGSISISQGTAAGRWHVAWECLNENGLSVSITVPFGCTAEVELPLAPEEAYERLGGRVLGPGTYEVSYETTEQVRRVPNANWTLGRILETTDTSEVLRRHVDDFDFVATRFDHSKSLRELQTIGLGQNYRMTADTLAVCDADLRALADERLA
ncbi:MAG: glycoside hydrolase family 78 protein [Atopobiaceae bacterium]|nr:glycoside hydrolase family 78 protein [Atopobiaceae bacterium]